MALAPQCLNQQTGYSFVQLKGCGIHKLPYSARTAFDTTSALGQTEKTSVRAYVFRFALELGHCSTQSACLKRANMYGPAVRCKTEAPRPTNVRAATMYQASNVEHLLRAIMGIRTHPRLTSGKTSLGHHGTQSLGCAGQTVRPSLHSISQTSVGKLSILNYLVSVLML